jgi:predicted thioesterase
MAIAQGLAGSARMEVSHEDTARAQRTGSVETLATPRLLALCEEATVAALAAAITEGQTSVGVGFQIEHISPSAVGTTVTAEAQLDRIEGRRLQFTVTARDDRGLVAAGKVTRVMVEVERFMEKCR